MKSLYLFVLFCFSLSAMAQNEAEPISIFETTNDFLYDIKKEALMEVRSSGESYFITKKFLDIQTGKKLKISGANWAIKRGPDLYFNMIYSDDMSNGIFIRLDITGRYCVAILDENSYKKAKAGARDLYGLSDLGFFGKSFNIRSRTLKDSADGKRYLVLIDTKLIEPRDWPRKEGSHANLLTKKKLAGLMKDNKLEGSAKDLSFEEVIDLIKSENAKEIESAK